MSTLSDIRIKVRRLTGRPSAQQITDTEIDSYINTFYLYDLPETLRLFSLHTKFEFMTTPNIDSYDLRTMQITKNGVPIPAVDLYYNISPPAYIAGYQSYWSQDNEQFFKIYPKLADINTSVTGNGSPGPYVFSLPNTPLLQRSVSIGAIDNTDSSIQVVDVPNGRSTGNWEIINTSTPVIGSINYLNGSGTITFSNNIPVGNEITISSVPYEPTRPQGLLFYDNILTLRPVPDKIYKVSMNAYQIPTAFISSNPSISPEIRQWWQFLAYGASKKIFEDVSDQEGVSNIMAGFKEQERLVLRKTIVQQTNQRAATIYTEQSQFAFGNYNRRF